MYNRKWWYLLVALIVLAAACKKKDDKPQRLLNNANVLLQQGNLNAAKITLDSIHRLFPRLIPVRQAADTVMYHIQLQEAVRNMAYVDSLLPLQKHSVDSLVKAFKYEKNGKYEDVGKYTFNTQANVSPGRTYPKIYVTEDGDITLMSIYCGAPTGYTKVKASANGIFCETHDAYGDSRTTFSNGGQSWENVSFTNADINGVDAFIAQNEGKITISLEGGKRSYSYTLAQSDRQAMKQTYLLARLLQKNKQLEQAKQRSKQRLATLCERLHLNEAEFLSKDK